MNIFNLKIRIPNTIHKNHYDLVLGRTYKIIGLGNQAMLWREGWSIGKRVVLETRQGTSRGTHPVIRAIDTNDDNSWTYPDTMEEFEIVLEDYKA